MRVAVGLSGGVDSAVAALLLKRAGHEVVGVTMKLWREGRYTGGAFDACFGPGEADDVAEAERIAAALEIPYETFDCADEYEREVLDYFRSERASGRTPNPCVVCNRRMKFGLLPRLAAEKTGCGMFATGHYARLARSGARTALLRAAHTAKDQSYFLWGLSQEQLSRAMFPLGGLSKSEVRQLAREAAFAVADKADSQDFYSGDEGEILAMEPREGEIVDVSGRVLGRHDGHWHFTVGQRKGLGIAVGEPMYVCGIDACRNRVVVGRREQAVSRAFSVSPDTVNWVSLPPTAGRIRCRVKVRSAGVPAGPVFWEDGRVEAPDGVFGVAPGQSAVFYSEDGGEVLFGGVIAASS